MIVPLDSGMCPNCTKAPTRSRATTRNTKQKLYLKAEQSLSAAGVSSSASPENLACQGVLLWCDRKRNYVTLALNINKIECVRMFPN